MFIGYIQGLPPLRIKDHRLMLPFYVVRNDPKPERTDYRTDYWPGCRGFVGDRATEVPVQDTSWQRLLRREAWGAGSRLGFAGKTRDANGSILAGVTCSLFRTSGRVWIMDVVSNELGEFLLSTFDATQHFIVFSKVTPPEVFGTTRQTLLGA